MGKVVPHLGDDLSVEGVAELHRQWEELRKKGEELDLAISSHLDRQRMVDRGVAESVELVCTKAAVVAALENWRST
jgi:bisphosphoglycerate-dependent phosphoglycerate mutase